MLEDLQQIASFRERVFGEEIKAKKWPYICMEEYVVKNGHEYFSQELTRKERDLLDVAVHRSMIEFEQRMCFYNSQILSIRDPSRSLVYVEGFCQTTFFPFLHGWVELNGKVIDMTLRSRNSPLGKQTKGVFGNRKYIGCKFPREIVVERVLTLEEGGSFLDDMFGNFPLLTGELVIDHENLKVLKGSYEHRRKKKRGKSR